MIFAAMYLLPAVQRIFFNKLDNPANEHLADLTPRELLVMLPLIFGMVWLGLYPKPVSEPDGGCLEALRRADSAGQGPLLRTE